MTSLSSWNRSLKRWPSWLAMGFIVLALMTVGVTRDSGPRTQQERIDSISRRLACPTCDGESVYVSQAAAAESIRNEVARQVATAQKSDDEIVAYIENRFGGKVLLVPRASGLDALVWVLPIAVLVCSVAGLAMAFSRWRSAQGLRATDEDEQLVESLMKENDRA